MVSKSPKQGNIPKPRYCRGEYWARVLTDSPFLFVVGIMFSVACLPRVMT